MNQNTDAPIPAGSIVIGDSVWGGKVVQTAPNRSVDETTISGEYIDLKVDAVDSDGKPATVGVIASKGEFDGVILALTTDRYECAELTVAGVDELIGALIAARDYLNR